ncbi:germination protein [Brevibacillus reuszeri]|uniref:Germination protein n=1 Tax=Brevibacillus reuszeri TaxID=54915 RepID=A0A0K9YQC8_9BACL|nr:endospore germination permease [Brevibacillus reuszeri]KNB70380.1 spore gernimation protein [Brevibacillus reuszeri]MED1857909.1 endospore germination permease [Brevibacillus reuszeri]GED71776.1 germination protein [Brevibacillus reuszeri]
MTEKTTISEMQMGLLLFPVIVATADLIVPAITTKYAHRDMWLSPVCASVIGFLTVYLIYKLHALYPGQTIIQYSTQIIGDIPGKIVGLIILYNLLYSDGNILRLYGEFIVGSFLYKTPLFVVMGSMILLCAFTIRSGIEALARAAHLLVPLLFLFYMGIVILMLPFMKAENFFPVLENGFIPVLRGAIAPQGWFSEVILFSFLIPFVSHEKKGMKTGFVIVSIAAVSLLSLNLSALLILGQEVGTMTYPFYTAVQMISYADFFENLDAIVIAIWVAGAFVKISMFYFALTLGTAQWVGMEDYRLLVLPLGLLLMIFSYWTAPDLSSIVSNIGKTIGFQTTGIFSVFPLLLYMIAQLRMRYGSKTGKSFAADSKK